MNMNSIKRNDTGAAVEDVQRRLSKAGFLRAERVTGLFDDDTAKAVAAFCRALEIEVREEVDDVVWAKLVDASFELGDRNLYLRVPFYHGADVRTLQEALSALGFPCGEMDGIFGPHTEDALRKFQLNMGLPDDGIAGAFTFRALLHLQHSWKDKDLFAATPTLGFARAAEVLENNLICLFGVTDFTRSVAARMSNLALATTPSSKVTSAESLHVSPDEGMCFVQILVGSEAPAGTVPVADFEPEASLPERIAQALIATQENPRRIAVRLPEKGWQDAGEVRSAQHYAIVLLDALCSGLVLTQER